MKRASLAYWICQAAGWGTYSVIGTLAAVYAVGARRWQIPFSYGLFFVYSIAYTHLLRREFHRRDWLHRPLRSSIWAIAGAALLCALAQTVTVLVVDRILNQSAGFPSLRSAVGLASGISLATTCWTALYIAIASLRRYQEARVQSLQLQLALKQAEMRALEAQINPHFLFNSLNTVRGLIEADPALARDLVTRLASLLRSSLDRNGAHLVTLAEELEIVGNYLAIESARFEERLQVDLQVPPDCLRAGIPAMLLQTLVENAIKHGIATLPRGGCVRLRVTHEPGFLVLDVENDGQLRESQEGTRLGLRNARERLNLLFAGNASLTLEQATPDVVRARIRMPEDVP